MSNFMKLFRAILTENPRGLRYSLLFGSLGVGKGEGEGKVWVRASNGTQQSQSRLCLLHRVKCQNATPRVDVCSLRQNVWKQP